MQGGAASAVLLALLPFTSALLFLRWVALAAVSRHMPHPPDSPLTYPEASVGRHHHHSPNRHVTRICRLAIQGQQVLVCVCPAAVAAERHQHDAAADDAADGDDDSRRHLLCKCSGVKQCSECACRLCVHGLADVHHPNLPFKSSQLLLVSHSAAGVCLLLPGA